MKCPACPTTTLVMADRQGVEIDYCPQCRGIWLDRGELDKLLDRAAAVAPANVAAPQQVAHPQSRPDFEDSDFRHKQKYGYAKRKSWLNEIFD